MFVLASFVALALSVTAAPISSEPIPPSQDPWYSAPTNYETVVPGEILRIRTAPGNFTTIFNQSSAAYNILYRTTDSNYNPSWAVTTLIVPKSTNTSALLSYQIPYNTADVDYSPSYSLYAPASALGDIDIIDIQTMLELGWHVNVPDFEGPLASFTLGIQEGHATLDSVRAALNTGFGLLGNNTRYALWGYSGGSLASGWAAELQNQYAPELNFSGAALGGLADNPTTIFYQDRGTWFSGLIPVALLGLTSQDPEAREYLLSQLKTEGPYNKSGFLEAGKIDIATAFEVFANQTVLQNYFVNGSAIPQAPLIQQIVDKNTYMGYQGIPQMPLFIYKAVQDEIVPIAHTDALVNRWCNVGVDIVFEKNTVGGHLAEETNGDGRALDFLKSVLGRIYDHQGCTIKIVSLNATDSLM
jgi:hypothetical protein